jgi:hypothetical protein
MIATYTPQNHEKPIADKCMLFVHVICAWHGCKAHQFACSGQHDVDHAVEMPSRGDTTVAR